MLEASPSWNAWSNLETELAQPPSLWPAVAPQAIAAVLSDGSLALLSCVEEDLWEETLEEQLEGQPWQG